MHEKLKQLAQEYFASSDFQVFPLLGDGSSRKYFVLAHQDKKIVAVENKDPAANERFYVLNKKFQEHDIPTPKIYRYSEQNFFLLEYLGTQNLAQHFEQQQQNLSPEEFKDYTFKVYQKILPLLVRLYFGGSQLLQAFPERRMVYAVYQEDAKYFAKHFCGFFQLNKFWQQPQEAALQHLITESSSFPVFGFVSRDFQARNIMWYCSRPYFIDYQDAMLGAPSFDLASLLYASASYLQEEQRKQIANIYCRMFLQEVQKTGNVQLQAHYGQAEENFFREFYPLLLIRRLRSLGTYGLLGHQQKKPYFASKLSLAVEELLNFAANPAYQQYQALFDFLATVQYKLPK